MNNNSTDIYKKKRIFVAVENNIGKGKPSVIYAVSEDEKHYFKREVDDKIGNYENLDDTPAAKVFEDFEAFCTAECGLTDDNDEVIFADKDNAEITDIFDYIAWRVGGVNWAVGKFIEFDYGHETTHIESPLSFAEFKKACDIGLSEPYATKHIYTEYRRLIHKDDYTREEFDRMERYLSAHLDSAYSGECGSFDVICRIAHICAAACRCDRTRFVRMVESIVSDYQRRQNKKKRLSLQDILTFTAEEVFDEGYIDYSTLAEEEKKPPMERKEYRIFRAVSPAPLEIITKIIEEYEQWTLSNS